MPDFEYTVDGAIAVMRFNRPERMNAITYEMLTLIEDAAREAAHDDRVRAVVVTGEGRAFSAGTDLQQLSSQPPPMGRAETLANGYGDDAPAPWTFPSIRKPVIAAVNGAAVGLGAEFTLQCDLRIAGESARFGWVFVHRGLVPDTAAGTWLLSRIVGLQHAARLLLLRRDHRRARSAAHRLRARRRARRRADGPRDGARHERVARIAARRPPRSSACCIAASPARRWSTSPTARRRSRACSRAKTSRKACAPSSNAAIRNGQGADRPPSDHLACRDLEAHRRRARHPPPRLRIPRRRTARARARSDLRARVALRRAR